MPLELTEVEEFTVPITVPEPGDDRTAASIVPAFQALANRTRSLLKQVAVLLTTNNAWTGKQTFKNAVTEVRALAWLNSSGVPYKPQRAMGLPITMLRENAWWAITDTPTHRIRSLTFGGVTWGTFVSPPGHEVTGVSIGAILTANPDVPIPSLQVDLLEHQWNPGSGSTIVKATNGVPVQGVGNYDATALLTVPQSIISGTNSWRVRVTATGSVDIVSICYIYNDAGLKAAWI
jgi:hypothetical protein